MSDSPAKSFAAIVLLFWDILRLRRGPDELPASRVLLAMTIVAQVAVGLLLAAMLPALPVQAQTEDHSITLLVIELAVPLLWGWAVLRAAGRPERYLQTMTAVFGCQLVLQPLVVPAAWALGYYDKESQQAAAAGLVLMCLVVWTLVATIRVLRSATGWSAFSCAAMVIGQVVLTSVIALAVFPDLLKLK